MFIQHPYRTGRGSDWHQKRQLYFRGGNTSDVEDQDALSSELGLENKEQLKPEDSQATVLQEIGEVFTLSDAEFQKRYAMTSDEPVTMDVRQNKFQEIMNDFSRNVSDNALAVIQELKGKAGAENIVNTSRTALDALIADPQTIGKEGDFYRMLSRNITRMGLRADEINRTRDLSFDLMIAEKELDATKEELGMVDDELADLGTEQKEARQEAKEWREQANKDFNIIAGVTAGVWTIGGAAAVKFAGVAASTAFGWPVILGGAAMVGVTKLVLKPEKRPFRAIAEWAQKKRKKVTFTREYEDENGNVTEEEVTLSKAELEAQRAEEQKTFNKAKRDLDRHNKKIQRKEDDFMKTYAMAEKAVKMDKENIGELSAQHSVLLLKRNNGDTSPELAGQITSAETAVRKAREALQRSQKALEAMKDVKRLFDINRKFAASHASGEILNEVFKQNLNPELYEKVQKMAEEQDQTTLEAQREMGSLDKRHIRTAVASAEQDVKDTIAAFLTMAKGHRPVDKRIAQRYLDNNTRMRPLKAYLDRIQRRNPDQYKALHTTLIQLSTLPPTARYKVNTVQFLERILTGQEDGPEDEREGLEVISNAGQRQRVLQVLDRIAQADRGGNDVLLRIFNPPQDNDPMAPQARPDDQCLRVAGEVFNLVERQEWANDYGGFPLSAAQTERVLRTVALISMYRGMTAEGARSATSDNLAYLNECIRNSASFNEFIRKFTEGIDVLNVGVRDDLNSRRELESQYPSDAHDQLARRQFTIDGRGIRLDARPLGHLSLNLLGPLCETEAKAEQLARTIDTIEQNDIYHDVSRPAGALLGDEYLLAAAVKAAQVAGNRDIENADQGYLVLLQKFALVEKMNKVIQDVADKAGIPETENALQLIANATKPDGSALFPARAIDMSHTQDLGVMINTARVLHDFFFDNFRAASNYTYIEGQGLVLSSPEVMRNEILSFVNPATSPFTANTIRLLTDPAEDPHGEKLRAVAIRHGIPGVSRDRAHPTTGVEVATGFVDWVNTDGHGRNFYNGVLDLMRTLEGEGYRAYQYVEGGNNQLDYARGDVIDLSQALTTHPGLGNVALVGHFFRVADTITGGVIGPNPPAGVDVTNLREVVQWLTDNQALRAPLRQVVDSISVGRGAQYTIEFGEILPTAAVEALSALGAIDPAKRDLLYDSQRNQLHRTKLLQAFAPGLTQAGRAALAGARSQAEFSTVIRQNLPDADCNLLRAFFENVQANFGVTDLPTPNTLSHNNVIAAKQALQDLHEHPELSSVPGLSESIIRDLRGILVTQFHFQALTQDQPNRITFLQDFDTLNASEGNELEQYLRIIIASCNLNNGRLEVSPKTADDLNQLFTTINPGGQVSIQNVVSTVQAITQGTTPAIPNPDPAILAGGGFINYARHLNALQRQRFYLAMRTIESGYVREGGDLIPQQTKDILDRQANDDGAKADVWAFLENNYANVEALLFSKTGQRFDDATKTLRTQILETARTIGEADRIKTGLQDLVDNYIPWITNGERADTLRTIEDAEGIIDRKLDSIERAITLRVGASRQASRIPDVFDPANPIDPDDFEVWALNATAGGNLTDIGMELQRDNDGKWLIHQKVFDRTNPDNRDEELLRNYGRIGFNLTLIEGQLTGRPHGTYLRIDGNTRKIERMRVSTLNMGDIENKAKCVNLEWT